MVNISLDQAIAFDPFEVSADLGGFILVDRISNATSGAGMIRFALRRSHNIHRQALDVTPQSRADAKGQKPAVLWFTGLSGAGKSTIANAVERQLHAAGKHTYILDGDNIRHGLNNDLGFSPEDRTENIRRIGEVAKLFTDGGVLNLTAFISPYRSDRDRVRSIMGEGDFIEVHVDCPVEECERRDVKGLYAKARAGKIPEFTGISAPYEAPEKPEIVLETAKLSEEQSVAKVLEYLEKNGYIAKA